MDINLTLVSFEFILFMAVTAVLYYILPVKVRFVAILVANAFFLYNNNSYISLAIWLGMGTLTYLSAVCISKIKSNGGKKAVAIISVILLAATLIILQDSAFFKLPKLNVSPIGISYYTLSWIAYVLQVNWGMCEAEINPLKFFAFAGFFPLLSSGPIVSYKEVGKNITDGNKIAYNNIVNGLVRIAWGLMKKLVIADRISTFVDSVYLNPYGHPGLFFLVANAFFVIQLYMDFSGCIDIALGSAQILGITLPENFDLPFMSETLEEFWRKWHITLGGWLRDYILYPILKSTPWQKMGALTKKVFGKKLGKKIPVWVGLMISWFLVGFWHGGGWNYIFGVGLLFGAIIVLSEMLSGVFEKITSLLHINTNALSYRAFRIVRTWLIFGTGLSFFRANSILDGFRNLKIAFSVFNPWIFFDGSMYEQGLDRQEMAILFIFILIVAIGGIVRYITKKQLREIMAEQNVLFRIIVYALLIICVVVYGSYGDGFSSASFIYQGF